MRHETLTIVASVIILTGALLYARLLTEAFIPGTTTQDHPALAICLALGLAGLAWMLLLRIFCRRRPDGRLIRSAYILPVLILTGIGLRVLFFDSNPVYENDFKRYLWDGAVTANAQNPYTYSPSEIYEAGKPGASSVPDLARLAIMSNEADFITGAINSPLLTTIYPPAAQAVFALAYAIAPFSPAALKFVFLMIEGLGLAALIACLRARGLSLELSALYWLNPIIIFTTYNGLHMDVLLVSPLLAAVLWSVRRPWLAALMLSLAAAIKLWPLILAPVLFRQWRGRPGVYVGVAGLIAGLTALSVLPMVMSMGESSGLRAYSANWTNSSFLFPLLRAGLGVVTDNPNALARYVIAAIIVAASLRLGFKRPQDPESIAAHVFLLTALFVLLSPTGYPWYFIWFLMFLPLVAEHFAARGLALLSVLGSVYFLRFSLGESGQYHLYTHVLVPIEFGLPLLVVAWDYARRRAHD